MISQTEMWNAVVSNDEAFDGTFYYAVQTTGIFCKPSCKSKNPIPSHVQFFKTKEDAMQEGFRPCKRCRPDLLVYMPQQELMETIRTIVDSHFTDLAYVKQAILSKGISYAHCSALWKKTYGYSISQYANQLRYKKAMKLLTDTDETIMSIAMQCGFTSLSSFYAVFKQNAAISPISYRKQIRSKSYDS